MEHYNSERSWKQPELEFYNGYCRKHKRYCKVVCTSKRFLLCIAEQYLYRKAYR